jgi:cysteine-rich repeat protein
MNVCEECTALGTVDCIDRNTSTACTSFFNLSGSVCVEVCGDGVLYNLECDDGNTVDGDGCSSTC